MYLKWHISYVLCGVRTRTCYEIPLVSSINALANAYMYELRFEKHCCVLTCDSCEYIMNLRMCEPTLQWILSLLDCASFSSWIKIDQLDITYFIISLFTAHHVSDVSTSIFRILRLIVDLFHVLYCSGSMRVGVTVWFGWGGVVSLCRLKH